MKYFNCTMRSLCFIAGSMILLSSCYGVRKAKLQHLIARTNAQQVNEQSMIEKIEEQKNTRRNNGDIDSTIDAKIQERLNQGSRGTDSVKEFTAALSASLENRKTFRKTYRSIIKSKIIFLRSKEEMFEKRVLNYGLIEDVLNNARQSQFDLASFFGLGEFMIPADKMEQATVAFAPIVDSIMKLAAKYPSIAKNSTIVLKGYADATGIVPGSVLFYRLANELGQDNPSDADMNLALSKLRAESISEVVSKILVKKQRELLQLQTIITIELVQEGRGEEKPNAAITNYTAQDARRRIVLLFWSMLPQNI